MVDIPSAPDVAPQAHLRQGMAAAFETMSRRYAAMDMDGCTDEERARASAMAHVTHELATRAAHLPKVDTPDARSLAASPAYPQFVDALRDFEKRRLAMQQDLERMRAVRLR